MSKTRLFALALAFACAAPAFAQQGGAPVLFGRQDFEMEWKVEPLRITLSARYLAAKRLMRLEVLDGASRVVIRDLATGEALLLVGQGQGGAYKFKLAPLGTFQPGEGGAVRQIGTENCRDFAAGPVTLCVSEDGIPLQMSFTEGTLTASRLLRQPQPAALFELPKGLVPKPLPAGQQPPPLPF